MKIHETGRQGAQRARPSSSLKRQSIIKSIKILLTCAVTLCLFLVNLRIESLIVARLSTPLDDGDAVSLDSFNHIGDVHHLMVRSANDDDDGPSPSFLLLEGPTHHHYEILPRQHITVVGLESSGTTFVTQLLSNITGVPYREGVARGTNKTQFAAPNRALEILHLSLPWGNHCTEYKSQTTTTTTVLDVMYPNPCIYRRLDLSSEISPQVLSRMNLPPSCQKVMGKDKKRMVIFPPRFFINITSHVKWYREHGVLSTAVIVVRDKTMGHYARSLSHCPNPDLVRQEEQVGLELIREALEKLPILYPDEHQHVGKNLLQPPPPAAVVVVSYESLLHVGQPYLNSILRQLRLLPIGREKVQDDIGDDAYQQDANVKYVKDWNTVKKEAQMRAFNERYNLAVSASEEFGRTVPPRGEDWDNIMKDVNEEPIDDDLIPVIGIF